MNAQLSQGVADKVAPANVKDQEGASGQQRLQGEKHEDVLQVGPVDRHLERHVQERSYHSELTCEWGQQPALPLDRGQVGPRLTAAPSWSLFSS